MAVVLGATLAGIFPAVLGVAGARFPAHSGTVFGLLFTMALTGGMTLPWVTGQAAAAWGLRPALGLVVVQFLAVFALQWRVLSRTGVPPARQG
jgi:fucose permease